MTTETPDPFDTSLQNLFAAIHPPADFEDRLVNTLRQHRRMRLTIPAPIIKAAIAAAAVLAVGTVGYYGNLALTGNLRFSSAVNRDKSASNLHQIGLAILLDKDADKWDFGGGSNSAQNWSDFNGDKKNLSYSYEDPFASGKPISNGWQFKDSVARSQKGGQPPLSAPTRADAANKSPAPWGLNTYTGNTRTSGGTVSSTGNESDRKSNDIASFDALKESTVSAVASSATNGTLKLGDNGLGLKYFHGNIAASGDIANFGGGNFAGNDGLVIPTMPANGRTHRLDGQSTQDAITTNSPKQETDAPAIAKGLSKAMEDLYSEVKGGQAPLTPQIVAGTLQFGATDVPTNGEADEKERAVLQQAVVNLQAQRANPVTAPTTAPVVDDRKIIRTGSMEFEVDRFDTAQTQITKIVGELGGFVGATDSTKLPNGKVRGSISVRVPPERLDTLVLSLRALGDLKSQQITAADITKEYTDIQSELTADRAMQDRLLDLIHNGKGSVKELLAAENELGNWRSKIEKAEGMIRYYNGRVALSTLSITLSERDIQTPATAVETETADMGIEADDVEKARISALKAIDDVKGRVVEAELKRYDAGQLAARLVADVPPDSAGAVIDQLKLLGKVARLEIHRQETNSDGTNTSTATTPLKTERKATRLLISIYNLANVAPRRTTNVSLAAADVETAYTALATAAKSNGGRVVTSALDRGDPVKASGSLVLEFPPDKFESVMTALRAQGDVLKLTLTENPDTQNSTEAKTGLTVQLVSLAAVPPRENIQQTLAATDVPTAYQAVVNAANAAHARTQSAQLNEQDRQNVTADLQLEIPRTAEADFDKAVTAAGGTIARASNRAAEAEGTVDSKVSLHLSITSADHLAPRETTRLQVETADVDKSAADAQAAAVTAGGRVLEASVTKDRGKGQARIILDLPMDKAANVLQQIRGEGTVRGIDASRDPQAPAGPLAHAQIFVEFTTGDAIVADQTGPWASIRQGLSTSITGLLWSLQWVIVGMCLIVPWFAIGWIGWKLWKRWGRANGSAA